MPVLHTTPSLPQAAPNAPAASASVETCRVQPAKDIPREVPDPHRVAIQLSTKNLTSPRASAQLTSRRGDRVHLPRLLPGAFLAQASPPTRKQREIGFKKRVITFHMDKSTLSWSQLARRFDANPASVRSWCMRDTQAIMAVPETCDKLQRRREPFLGTSVEASLVHWIQSLVGSRLGGINSVKGSFPRQGYLWRSLHF